MTLGSATLHGLGLIIIEKISKLIDETIELVKQSDSISLLSLISIRDGVNVM